jgi:hypothetical protein
LRSTDRQAATIPSGQKSAVVGAIAGGLMGIEPAETVGWIAP